MKYILLTTLVVFATAAYALEPLKPLTVPPPPPTDLPKRTDGTITKNCSFDKGLEGWTASKDIKKGKDSKNNILIITFNKKEQSLSQEIDVPEGSRKIYISINILNPAYASTFKSYIILRGKRGKPLSAHFVKSGRTSGWIVQEKTFRLTKDLKPPFTIEYRCDPLDDKNSYDLWVDDFIAKPR